MNNIPLKYQPQVKQLVNKAYTRGFVKGQKSREKEIAELIKAERKESSKYEKTLYN